MSVISFEGGAGSGKTHRLIETLVEILNAQPLRDGQRVLAVTFMHGSRRRLHGRLRGLTALSSRFDCVTLDSFAWHLIGRWRTLCARLIEPFPTIGQFESVCDLAARLLELDPVCSWAAASFPIVLVDEAQDLTIPRLRIVRALARRALVLIAADEFQCLQEELRPNPFAEWAAAELKPERLTRFWRTNIPELLDAAAALRVGEAPVSGKCLKITTTQSSPLAGSFLSNQIGWYVKGGTVAVITPSVTRFVVDTVSWVHQNTTKKGQGPFAIRWERTDREESQELLGRLVLPKRAPIAEVLASLDELNSPQVEVFVRNWITTQHRALGRDELDRSEIEATIETSLAHRRRFGLGMTSKLAAMTVHAAKNREFDGVVVLWPFQVSGDDEQKRRLLYNAITRARRWCHVLVQSDKIRTSAPFA